MQIFAYSQGVQRRSGDQADAPLAAAQSEFVHGMQTGFRVTAAIMVLIALAIVRWYPNDEMVVPGTTK
jgi:hypothetical protein